MVFVPIIGMFLKRRTRIGTWLGVMLSVVGLYFLCVTSSFSISKGDLYEIVGDIFWAIHILLIDHFAKKIDPLKLSFVQFITCAIFSLSAALFLEKITMNGLCEATIPILYGGILSVGGAYTLQVVGQKNAKPANVAIILSLEAVFASIGGVLILHENLGLRGFVGAAFMLSGMVFAQLSNF